MYVPLYVCVWQYSLACEPRQRIWKTVSHRVVMSTFGVALWRRFVASVHVSMTLVPAGGNCTRGSRGSFTLPESARASWRAAHAFCAARCLSCGRCAVVSVSLRWVNRWLDLGTQPPQNSAPTSRLGLAGS